MADRQFSWQKENPIANPAKYAEIMADIDARNQPNLANIRVYLFLQIKKKTDLLMLN